MLHSLTLSFLCIRLKLFTGMFQRGFVLFLMIPTSRGSDPFPEGMYSQVMERGPWTFGAHTPVKADSAVYFVGSRNSFFRNTTNSVCNSSSCCLAS